MRTIILILFSLFAAIHVHAQLLKNGDLEGGQPLPWFYMPDYWGPVLYTDPVCQATSWSGSTATLTGLSGPSEETGIFGHPQSGYTFVSGSHSSFVLAGQTKVSQGGIRQIINGFAPGQTYELGFYQSVMLSYNDHPNAYGQILDPSGSWAVYIDSMLIGVSLPTQTTILFDDPNLHWEYRVMRFTATQPVHTLKFLPFDDDENISVEDHEGVLMGIDNITMDQLTSVESPLSRETINIFPNPASETLHFDGGALGVDKVKIVNNLGKHISVLHEISGFTFIDVSHLPQGIYIISFYRNGEVVSERFSVVR